MNYEHLCYDNEVAQRITQHGDKQWISYKCQICGHETTYPYDERQGPINVNEERKAESTPNKEV